SEAARPHPGHRGAVEGSGLHLGCADRAGRCHAARRAGHPGAVGSAARRRHGRGRPHGRIDLGGCHLRRAGRRARGHRLGRCMMSVVTTQTEMMAAPRAVPPARPRIFTLRRFTTPIVVVVILGLLLAWVLSLELDSIEQRTLNWEYITRRVGEHLSLTVVASALVAVLAIPVGLSPAKSP